MRFFIHCIFNKCSQKNSQKTKLTGHQLARMVLWIVISTVLACENSHPSSLLARVAFCVIRTRSSRETPLGQGPKKDGCFRRLPQYTWVSITDFCRKATELLFFFSLAGETMIVFLEQNFFVRKTFL